MQSNALAGRLVELGSPDGEAHDHAIAHPTSDLLLATQLDDVTRCMQGKIADPGKYSALWLKTMKKRGWVGVEGQPLKDWKPFAEQFCQ